MIITYRPINIPNCVFFSSLCHRQKASGKIVSLSEICTGEETILWTCKFDLSFNTLAFPYFFKGEGGITHPPFLVIKYACVLSITIYIYLVPEFREGGNLQLQVSATINWEEDDDIDIGEWNMCMSKWCVQAFNNLFFSHPRCLIPPPPPFFIWYPLSEDIFCVKSLLLTTRKYPSIYHHWMIFPGWEWQEWWISRGTGRCKSCITINSRKIHNLQPLAKSNLPLPPCL